MPRKTITQFDPDEPTVVTSKAATYKQLLKMVLLFHAKGWSYARHQEWIRLAGDKPITTETLLSAIRAAGVHLGELDREDL